MSLHRRSLDIFLKQQLAKLFPTYINGNATISVTGIQKLSLGGSGSLFMTTTASFGHVTFAVFLPSNHRSFPHIIDITKCEVVFTSIYSYTVNFLRLVFYLSLIFHYILEFRPPV